MKQKLNLYFRYVDDNFPSFNKEFNSHSFLTALNSLHACLTSIFEKEANGKLSYPDVLVQKADSDFLRSIQKKTIFTGQYTLHVGSLWPSKTENQSYWNHRAQRSVYVQEIQTITRAGRHQSYSQQKWLPRQCYLFKYVHDQWRTQGCSYH